MFYNWEFVKHPKLEGYTNKFVQQRVDAPLRARKLRAVLGPAGKFAFGTRFCCGKKMCQSLARPANFVYAHR
jgi:hypothetical protein